MQHHFESNLAPFEEPHSAAPEDRNRQVLELFAGPRGNFMYYWYGSLYVVVEGFRSLHLTDQGIEALLGSPNANALRRCRNGAFHFKPTYFSARSLKVINAPDFVNWVREVPPFEIISIESSNRGNGQQEFHRVGASLLASLAASLSLAILQ